MQVFYEAIFSYSSMDLFNESFGMDRSECLMKHRQPTGGVLCFVSFYVFFNLKHSEKGC